MENADVARIINSDEAQLNNYTHTIKQLDRRLYIHTTPTTQQLTIKQTYHIITTHGDEVQSVLRPKLDAPKKFAVIRDSKDAVYPFFESDTLSLECVVVVLYCF